MATLSRAPGEAANQAGCARAVRGRAASARLWHGHAGLGPCPHRPGCPTPCQPGRCARTGVLVGASGRRAFRAPVWPHLAVRVDRAKVALGGPAALATTLGCSLVFLAAHPVGALAAAVSLDSFIRVFDVDTGASVATLEAPPSEVWCVQFHPKAINACETPSEQVHNKLKPAGSKCLCNTKYLRNWIQHVLKEKFVTIKNWIALPKSTSSYPTLFWSWTCCVVRNISRFIDYQLASRRDILLNR
ncbi:hypothetical protein BDA96_08G070800 [Sorghum bicolor]|uniref:Uncharacterized protein n=1 Tax=Sorghum bicolor TaxID=4558 RepID=A0A921QE32_SORBI|nr:hypothetical protein BDA96_08G070800 [Sorghum bicolor]